jgi:hypothetical protein
MNNQIKIEDILKYLRDQIGIQAQEIAILKATIDKLSLEQDDKV